MVGIAEGRTGDSLVACLGQFSRNDLAGGEAVAPSVYDEPKYQTPPSSTPRGAPGIPRSATEKHTGVRCCAD